MSFRTSAAGLATVLGVLAATYSTASAAIPPRLCQYDVHSPQLGAAAAVLPSNTPAFAVYTATKPEVTAPRLLDAASNPVAITRQAIDDTTFFLAPAAALAQGDYKAEFASPCPDEPATSGNFRIGAAAPLPTTAGRVSVNASNAVPTAAGGDIIQIELALTPEASLRPFAPVARLSLDLDGSAFQPGAFGDVPNEPKFYVNVVCGQVQPVGSCAGPNRTYSTPGKHRLTVNARLAGAPTLTPTNVDIDVDCGQRTVAVSGQSTIALPPAQEREPVGDRDDDAAAVEATNDGGGCRVATGSATSSFATFGLAMACAAIVARRRRA